MIPDGCFDNQILAGRCELRVSVDAPTVGVVESDDAEACCLALDFVGLGMESKA